MSLMHMGQHSPGLTLEWYPDSQIGREGHGTPWQGSLQMGQHCLHEGVTKPSRPQSGMLHTTPSHAAFT